MKRRLLATLLSIQCAINLFGIDNISEIKNPPKNIVFERYGAAEGLSNLIVYDIVQDEKGFLWLATGNGLSRFDGYSFVNFLPDENDPDSIRTGPVTDLLLDSRGRMWAAVIGSGLFEYNFETSAFKNYSHDPENDHSISSNNVYNIAEDKNGTIWASTTDRGLNSLDNIEGRFIRYETNPETEDSLNSNKVFALYTDHYNKLWISTIDGGINLLDMETGKFSNPLKEINQAVSIVEDSFGDMWIGSVGTGLVRYDRKNDVFITYRNEPENEKSISHNTVIKIIEDSLGTIWISTWGGGLNIYDRSSDSFHQYRADENRTSLSSNDCWALFEDRSGVLWVGTYGSGINRYDRKSERFSHNLKELNVKALYKDSEGDLWIGTIGRGLFRFDSENGSYARYEHDPGDEYSLSNNSIWMIDGDEEGNLWIATEMGLNRFEKSTQRFIRYFNDEGNRRSINGNLVRSVLVDSRKSIWIGTQFGGVGWLNAETETFTQYEFTGVYNSSMIEDSEGAIWYGNGLGLFRLEYEGEAFERELPIGDGSGKYLDRQVTSIQEGPEGFIWVGTPSELIRYDKESQTWESFTSRDGLIDNAIASITPDDSGSLWIGTSKGISRLDINELAFKNYEIASINRFASVYGGGEIHMGSLRGFISFSPEEIVDNPIPPPIVLTSFKLFNEEVSLAEPVEDLKFLELSYRDNFFSFEFSALDYSDPDKNQYRYKMEGFDNQWISVPSDRRFASYTNLDSGRYTFRVQASNSDGIWNEEGANVELTIIPPFTETRLFQFLLSFTIIVIVFLVAIYIIKLLQAINKQKVSELKIEALKKYQADIIDSMPSLIIGVDKEGRITQWNKRAFERTSISPRMAKGQALNKLVPEYIYENDKIQQSMATGKIIRQSDVKVRGEENPQYMDITIYPLSESEGNGAVIRIDDVTEKHQMTEHLNHHSRMDGIGQLAGGIAHDFNNMLGGIISSAQLLAMPKRRIGEDNLKYVELILKASYRATDLTTKLLAFSRKEKVILDSIDVHDVIDDFVHLFKRTADKKVSILIEPGSQDSQTMAEFTGLQNVFLNLGINSSHAMPDGGEIKVSTSDVILDEKYCELSVFDINPGKYCRIEFADTGTGIPQELQKKIFEPFYTTKKKDKGTGLGLAAVYNTIVSYHGEIYVKSQMGLGTSFIILLPCTEKDTIESKEHMEIVKGSGKVLIVDDEEIIRLTGAEMLQELGYEVLQARNGREALEIFEKEYETLDLVIMDMIMPELDGKDAFAKMRAIDKNARIIISSGYLKKENFQSMLDSGLEGIIAKPFNIDELSKLISETLES